MKKNKNKIKKDLENQILLHQAQKAINNKIIG